MVQSSRKSASKPRALGASASESSSELLKAAGLRKTQPRLAVLDALNEHHGPFTTDEIHGLIRGAKLDLVTVYRTLGSFEKLGIVRRCDFGDGVARYELGSETHHHHHVICRVCRKAEPLDDCVLERLEKDVQKLGYGEITHSLEFFGVCRDCAK